MSRNPSSGTAGFFQSPPQLFNQFEDDHILRHLAETHLSISSHIHNELNTFGEVVLQPDIFSLIADAERNPPTVSTHSTFGKARTVLNTSYGWRELQKIGISAGMVAIPYDTKNTTTARFHQFLKYHLWTGSCAIVTCPSAMTDGAATLLQRHLHEQGLDKTHRQVLANAYSRLTSRDPHTAWTSGQWMTERSGGSDVRGTETVAVHTGNTAGTDAVSAPLGPWSISGFKWFSSATDSQMTVLLAQTDKGLSAFYAPMRRTATDGSIEMNGVEIQRLKPKLGTRALPTAELVLNGMRAWLIGKEGEGVREISAILNITRIHNAISALGLWGRALAISRAYSKVRKVSGTLLQHNPAHTAAMASNTVNYAAHMQLGFFVVRLLDIVEQSENLQAYKDGVVDVTQAKHLLRLLTPVAKAQCSKQAIHGIQECMESLGGIGYIEDEQEFNIARLFRDTAVLSIWEGTTDVMADDVVRVLKGREGTAIWQSFTNWTAHAATHSSHGNLQDSLRTLNTLVSLDAATMRLRGRQILEVLAWTVSSILLLTTSHTDDTMRAIAASWLDRPPRTLKKTEDSVAINASIVYGRTNAHMAKL